MSCHVRGRVGFFLICMGMAEKDNKLKAYGKLIGANRLEQRRTYYRAMQNKKVENPDIEDVIDEYFNK